MPWNMYRREQGQVQYHLRRHIDRYRKVSKARDRRSEFSDRFKIWQASRQHAAEPPAKFQSDRNISNP